MKRSTPLRRKTRLSPRRARPRRAVERPRRPRAGADPAYLAIVRRLRCCARTLGPCRGPSVAHHPRHLAPGVGRKGPDNTALPLCSSHHDDLHALRGAFKGWTREKLREWQDGFIELVRVVVGIHRQAAKQAAQEG